MSLHLESKGFKFGNNSQGKQTRSSIMENNDFSKQDCSLNVYNEASKRGKKECKSAAGNCKNAAVGFLFYVTGDKRGT